MAPCINYANLHQVSYLIFISLSFFIYKANKQEKSPHQGQNLKATRLVLIHARYCVYLSFFLQFLVMFKHGQDNIEQGYNGWLLVTLNIISNLSFSDQCFINESSSLHSLNSILLAFPKCWILYCVLGSIYRAVQSTWGMHLPFSALLSPQLPWTATF